MPRPPLWLEGVHALEAGDGLAIAYAGHLLARLGATVWKVEPPQGDPLRFLGPFPDDRPDPERGAHHLFYDGGKRSLAIDPGRPGDRALMRRLARAADVLLVDAGWARAIGARSQARRGAVAVVVTPFGLTGPYRHLPACDLVLQAMMGLAYITGEPDRPPLQVGLPVAELMAGQLAAGIALSCLWRRRQGGRGVLVDLSCWEAALTAMEHAPMAWSYQRRAWQRRGNLRALAGWGLYPCRDGYVGVISGLGDAYRRFLAMVGPPLTEPRFAAISARTRLADEMHAAILTWLAGRGREEVVREAQARGLPFGYLHTVEDLLRSPQLRARRFFRVVRQPGLGETTVPYAPFRARGVRWRLAPAPALNRHRALARHLSPRPQGPKGLDRDLPLAGVRVLEMAVVWAGPLCGRLLAEAGAEVIKLETARRPDLIRGPARPLHPADGVYPRGVPGQDPWNRHAYFNDRNRGKLGICLDLDRPEGRELARAIAARCDVVVENLSPGALARFGLDYATLSRLRRDIIYLSMPAQGLTGPERGYVGYGATNDLTSGLISVTGYEDGTPQNAGINVSDPVAAFHGFVAVAAALHLRQRSGRGLHIDLSQRESTAYFMAPYLLDYLWNGRVARPTGNAHPHWVPHGLYPCAGEDSWLAIAVRDDGEWQSLCRVVPSLAALSGLSQTERLARRREIDDLLAGWTRALPRAEAWRRLREAGVPSGPAYEGPALFADPHLRRRGFWVAAHHPSAGRRLYPGPPWRLGDGTPSRRPAPTLGQHNRLVLSRLLGLSQGELERLEQAGVLCQRPLDA
ncbi:MAG TPA: CoA transferase [Dehalococcoidia bacterium]|nr:CoA transferase [Dehalococcoidia bacterium]